MSSKGNIFVVDYTVIHEFQFLRLIR